MSNNVEKYVRLEPCNRGMECEHRDNPNPPTGDLVPCDLEADYRLCSPMWSDETCTRRCSIHVWDELERWVEKLKSESES